MVERGNRWRTLAAHGRAVITVVLAALVVSSCSTNETATTTPVQSKEALYARGHRLYLVRSFDSAEVALNSAVALDSTYAAPLNDLASLHFDRGMAADKKAARAQHYKEARKYYQRLEALGDADVDVYDHLCQIASALDDDKAFLRYAKKSAEKFPNDRQYFNLGVAYFNVDDYQNVVKTQKDAIAKFADSPYLAAYYRQLGRAYMKIGRDQTAERTLETGLAAVDQRLRELKQQGKPVTTDASRLKEDRVAILQLLRRLYTTYQRDEKLKNVDALLNTAGVSP